MTGATVTRTGDGGQRPAHSGTVCLTFDFDAVSAWIGAFGVRTPGVLSRGEYGARVGVPRVIEVLGQHDIRATFFVPGHTLDTFPDAARLIADHGHEIAHHGYVHESPTKYLGDPQAERAMYERGIDAIERLTGRRPRGYRSPGWDLTEESIGLLEDLGFEYDSSLAADDYHLYFARRGDSVQPDGSLRFGPPSSVVEVPVSWSWDDFPQFEFVSHPGFTTSSLAAPSKVLEIWTQDVDYMVERIPNGVFDLTCHPQVIGRGHRIMLLEKFIAHCRQYPSLTFSTVEEAARNFRKGAEASAARPA